MRIAPGSPYVAKGRRATIHALVSWSSASSDSAISSKVRYANARASRGLRASEDERSSRSATLRTGAEGPVDGRGSDVITELHSVGHQNQSLFASLVAATAAVLFHDLAAFFAEFAEKAAGRARAVPVFLEFLLRLGGVACERHREQSLLGNRFLRDFADSVRAIENTFDGGIDFRERLQFARDETEREIPVKCVGP